MKIQLIIIKIILFPYILISQNVISNSLDSEIHASDKKFLPITIYVVDNFDLANLKLMFLRNNTPIKNRASIICDTMQKVAYLSQKEILNIINKNNFEYQNLKTSWIVNSIFLNASKKLIYLLSSHPDVELIDLETTQSDTINYFRSSNQQYTENGTEPGIEAINVRPLWELGYTGKNQIVFNYDTGVWPSHPAFNNRFLANHYPMNQCWNGYFSSIPNGHVSDHGTHTLGTMAGLVETTNDTIGIAFNAYWIANDLVTSSVETLPPIADMITSFEWALNPDGNILTSYDVPDVINNSWRWYNEIDTFQCSGYAVELMNVIEAAGIANIFSAGNNGPDNLGVRSPQRINTNLVNTFAVGSINANSNDLSISNFSCRGPTQCPGEGSLSLYPEVVAPGQGIRSAWGNNEFNTISGTSMASPHVSGAVLLLKEAFPFLSGSEILLALYNTASDLGEQGEDNTYGMGIIDAFAAFNYLSETYNPIPPNYISNDIVLKQVTSNNNTINCNNELAPNIIVKNDTDSIIDNIIIEYINFTNPEQTNAYNFEINLNPNEELELDFPTIDLEINTYIGNQEFGFIISTINPLVEIDYHNNRKMLRLINKETYSLPYFENFQTGISNDWHIINDDYYRTWDTITTGGIENNNIAAYVNLFGYNPRLQQKDELIGPNIALIGDSLKLSLELAYQKYNNSSKQDTLQILLSTDCGQNWNDTILELGGEDLSTFDEITADFIPQSNNQWRQEIIDLNNYNGQEVMLKFVTTNLRGNNILIDNINIYNSNNVNAHHDLFNPTIYPNPSNGLFKLSMNNKFVNNISIVNPLGQLIINESINEFINTKYISILKEKPGLYLVKINMPDQHKILSIVKK